MNPSCSSVVFTCLLSLSCSLSHFFGLIFYDFSGAHLRVMISLSLSRSVSDHVCRSLSLALSRSLSLSLALSLSLSLALSRSLSLSLALSRSLSLSRSLFNSMCFIGMTIFTVYCQSIVFTVNIKHIHMQQKHHAYIKKKEKIKCKPTF